jgi:type III secretory pathway lipoprotein EscJ
MTWDTWRLGAAALAALAIACSVPVASDLEEGGANQVVVALERASRRPKNPIPRTRDAGGSASRGDASAAVTVLSQATCRVAVRRVLDALGESSLVPSRTAEHANDRRHRGRSRTIAARHRRHVVSARASGEVPVRAAFGTEAKEPAPTAGVLLAYRGANPPIALPDVQRLVAGAVPGLAADQVSVVMTAVPAPTKAADRELARFGPITVTRSSMTPLRLLVAGVALLNILLLGLLLALWMRMRRAQGALAEARAAAEAPGQSPR